MLNQSRMVFKSISLSYPSTFRIRKLRVLILDRRCQNQIKAKASLSSDLQSQRASCSEEEVGKNKHHSLFSELYSVPFLNNPFKTVKVSILPKLMAQKSNYHDFLVSRLAKLSVILLIFKETFQF